MPKCKAKLRTVGASSSPLFESPIGKSTVPSTQSPLLPVVHGVGAVDGVRLLGSAPLLLDSQNGYPDVPSAHHCSVISPAHQVFYNLPQLGPTSAPDVLVQYKRKGKAKVGQVPSHMDPSTVLLASMAAPTTVGPSTP